MALRQGFLAQNSFLCMPARTSTAVAEMLPFDRTLSKHRILTGFPVGIFYAWPSGEDLKLHFE